MRAKRPFGGGSVLSNQYVAGLFDGEGCISATKAWIKGKYEKYPRVRLQITITNSNRAIMDLLKEWFGGGYMDKRGKALMERCGLNPCYHWRICGKKNMTNFLNRIKKHAVIKKEEVMLALQFCETLRTENLGCTPLDKNEHGLREIVYQRLKLLKGK